MNYKAFKELVLLQSMKEIPVCRKIVNLFIYDMLIPSSESNESGGG